MATNIEEKSHNVPIEETFQQSKLLEHSMEESLRCKSQTSKSCYPLREILSHDSNSITTSCEANSIHESLLESNSQVDLVCNRHCNKLQQTWKKIFIMYQSRKSFSKQNHWSTQWRKF